MTPEERRTMLRGAVLLVVAGALRLAVSGPPAESPAPSELEHLTVAAEADREERARRSEPFADGETLDPNTADAASLDRLPGIGAATARAIVEARTADGPFRAPEDLGRVVGIGPRSVEKIAPFLTFGRAGAGPRHHRRVADGTVAVNRATEAELVRLPGIGPALAGRIVAMRESSGPFRDAEALLAVSGIGPRTLERIRDRLDFGR